MNEKIRIELVILDLDNTLYDWISFFVPAFYAMIDEAVKILNVEKETLLSDIRIIHQKYKNSEHPFALLETAAVQSTFPGKTRLELAELLNPAFHAFNKKRKANLKLYPGVLHTMKFIHTCGCMIIGYTEANVMNSFFRIESLGIRRFFKNVFAPQNQGLDHPNTKELYSEYIKSGFLRLLPKDHHKPDPKILEDILLEFKVSPQNVLYVGDSISKDISMAQQAGVHSALSHYGTNYDRELWEKLVRITHWTTEDVLRETQLKKASSGISPETVLENFSELKRYYDFYPKPINFINKAKNKVLIPLHRIKEHILPHIPGRILEQH